MMRIKTANLTARALDWAVGVAVELELKAIDGECFAKNSSGVFVREYSPTTNWGQLGPLLDKYVWKFKSGPFGCDAYVFHNGENTLRTGDNIAEAACRAIVASKLGDQVDVPEVLL